MKNSVQLRLIAQSHAGRIPNKQTNYNYNNNNNAYSNNKNSYNNNNRRPYRTMNNNPQRFNNFNNRQRRGPRRPRRFNNINSVKTIAAATRQQQPRRFRPRANTRPSNRQQARPRKQRNYRQTSKGKRFPRTRQINSVNDNHQKQLAEANAAAKAMRLTGCVGCMAPRLQNLLPVVRRDMSVLP